VFESLALATLIASSAEANLQLLEEYVRSHKHSYHLIYMLDIATRDRRLPIEALGAVFTAAMEFRSVRSLVELRVEGPEWDGEQTDQGVTGQIEIEIGIILGEDKTDSQTFEFRADISSASLLRLGSRLGNVFVSVPCAIQLGGAQELELTAPVDVTAQAVSLAAKALILRASPDGNGTPVQVVFEAESLDSHLEAITTNGVSLAFALEDASGVSYPAIQYVQKTAKPPGDQLFQQKYFRLKRILMAFRSHSKGALARYRHKIEHERVLKNAIGHAVLARLVGDEILSLQGNFYYLNVDNLAAKVGVSWQDLRRGTIPDSMRAYIRTIV